MTLFTSRSATIALKDPITDAVLITLTTQLRGLPTSESLEYVDRQYARSGSVTSGKKRSKGQLSIDKTPDGMALVRELKRWQEGILYYPLTSDLKGKVYRHPYLEISLTDSGTTEIIRAYGIRLASRSFDLPLSGPASDSISLDVLRGFDLSITEQADQGEPFKALSHFRTGSGTYTNTSGTFTTAGDGVARRNLIASSGDIGAAAWTKNGLSVTYGPIAPSGSVASVLTASGGATGHYARQGYTITGSYTVSATVKKNTYSYVGLRSATGGTNPTFNLDTGAWIVTTGTTSTSVSSLGSGWYRISATVTWAGTEFAGVCLPTAAGAESWTAAGTESVYLADFQFEAGTLTPCQPTNSSGVDLSNPLNGAGLVLEGASTNLLLYSQDFTNAAWQKIALGDGVAPALVSSTATAPDNTATACKYTFNGGTSGGGGQSQMKQAMTPGSSLGSSAYVWLKADAPCIMELRFEAPTATALINVTTSWQPFPISATVDRTYFQFGLRPSDGTSSGSQTIYCWQGQCEALPFPTSGIPTTSAAVTRNADLCGLTNLQNYLTYSEDFTQAATWIDGGTSSAQPTSAGLWTIANTDNTLYQAVTPTNPAPASLPWTFTVGLKAGTLSGSVQIQIEDQTGNLIGSAVTVATTSLSSTTTHFTVTATAAADDTGLRAKIKGNSGTGNITIVTARLEQASMPGVYCKTTDTALPKPTDGTEWPAWMTQNGQIEFDILPPSGGGTGLTYNLLGAELYPGVTAGTLRLWNHNGGTLYFSRKHNAASGTLAAGDGLLGVSNAAIYDKAKHHGKLVWKHYWATDPATGAWRRFMIQELWLDYGLVASQDVAALYGATAWIAPERLWLSDGSTYSTISNLVISVPTVPAGAIPA